MGILSSPEKSESLRANLRLAVSRGFHTGNLPFGYTYPPLFSYDQPAVLVDDEARVVSEVFSLALAGRTLAEIVIILQHKGMRGRNGYLGKSSIHSMLNNPFYAGMVRLNGEVYAGEHQKIISVEEFEQANRLLSARRAIPVSRRF